jgi:putative transposase
VLGGPFHVYARGNDRRRIFLDDRDRRLYLAMLGHVVVTRAWRCLAYCLMDNHVHLVVETRAPNLGDGMRLLQGSYAQRHNRRYGRTGHVFGERFGSVHLTSDEQVRAALVYVARNPVEAGLAPHAAAWRWSSHAAAVRAEPQEARQRAAWLDVARLLDFFDVGGEPARRYAVSVETGFRARVT